MYSRFFRYLRAGGGGGGGRGTDRDSMHPSLQRHSLGAVWNGEEHSMESQPLLRAAEEEGISSYNIDKDRVSASNAVPFDSPTYDKGLYAFDFLY